MGSYSLGVYMFPNVGLEVQYRHPTFATPYITTHEPSSESLSWNPEP